MKKIPDRAIDGPRKRKKEWKKTGKREGEIFERDP